MVAKCNNAYHRTIKKKPVDVKWKTYINFNKENNYKDPKFKVGNYVSVSNHKTIFAKVYFPDWPEETFVIKKL